MQCAHNKYSNAYFVLWIPDNHLQWNATSFKKFKFIAKNVLGTVIKLKRNIGAMLNHKNAILWKLLCRDFLQIGLSDGKEIEMPAMGHTFPDFTLWVVLWIVPLPTPLLPPLFFKQCDYLSNCLHDTRALLMPCFRITCRIQEFSFPLPLSLPWPLEV